MAKESKVIRKKQLTRHRRREQVKIDIYRLMKDRRGECSGDSLGWGGCEAHIRVHSPTLGKKRKLSIYRRRLIQSKYSHRGCVKYLVSGFEINLLWSTTKKLTTVDHLRSDIFVHCFVNRGRESRERSHHDL
jgi:hypothetical protein